MIVALSAGRAISFQRMIQATAFDWPDLCDRFINFIPYNMTFFISQTYWLLENEQPSNHTDINFSDFCRRSG